MDEFAVIGEISDIVPIARGMGVRERERLNRAYGNARWRKLKGQAIIQLRTGRMRRAELHWFEAHGIGRREMKRKRYLDWQ